MHVVHTQSYELHHHKLVHDLAGDISMVTGSEPAVPKHSGAYTYFFSLADLKSMPSLGHHNLVSGLVMSEKKLKILCSNVKV
jgi:hypothetical protein